MRTAPLSVLISATLLASSAFAQDTATVTGIETEISTKQTEFEKQTLVLQQQLEREKQLQKQLESLQGQAARLEQKRNQSLDMMNEMYRRFVNDPSLDLSDSQAKYQQSVDEFKQNKRDITLQLDAIATQSQETERLHLEQKNIQDALSDLQNRLAKARVARLYNEFHREGTLEVIHTVNCQRTETFAGCEKRGQQQALNKASNRFLDQVFDNLSERRLIEAKRSQTDAHVKILSSHVVESSFSGQGNYNVNLSVNMQGEVNGSRLCSLLELDNLYCADYSSSMAGTYQSGFSVSASPTSYEGLEFKDVNQSVVSVDTLKKPQLTDYNKLPSAQESKGQEVAKIYKLTLRSNVKNDDVWIDGLSYGPTRLTVDLAAGMHDIEVRKEGYRPYKVRMKLEKNQTIHAKLVKKTESIAEPTHQREQVTNYRVIKPAGEPEFSKTPFDVLFSDYQDYLGETGITPGQGGHCPYYIPAKSVWLAGINWRTLYLQEQGRVAAICLNQSDADDFSHWLFQQTGYKYKVEQLQPWNIPMQVKGKVSSAHLASAAGSQLWQSLIRGMYRVDEAQNDVVAPIRFRLFTQLL